MPPIIEVDNLHKSFGDTHALAGVSFQVERGSVLGLLGPNGAGKTTAVRVLATLLAPDQGTARVGGLDVSTQANAVRSIIGLTGQYAAVDEKLTGAENLRMVGRLLGMSSSQARSRATVLLERFDLSDAADRQVTTYSGGMRRRVDLAVSLVGSPEVLFLDEPTTGLDPASRSELWAITRELVADGTTVLLTTQYLDEADELADRIVVIDHGQVIEEGTADELKDRTGGRSLEIEFETTAELAAAASVLQPFSAKGELQQNEQDCLLSLSVDSDTALAVRAIAALTDAGLSPADFRLHRPSLDDVFMALTGHGTETEEQEGPDSIPGNAKSGDTNTEAMNS